MYALCEKYASASLPLAQASEFDTEQPQPHSRHSEDVENIIEILTDMESRTDV
jgi:hypothetical protein